MGAGTAFESVASGYEPDELPHTLPGMAGADGFIRQPLVFVLLGRERDAPLGAVVPNHDVNDTSDGMDRSGGKNEVNHGVVLWLSAAGSERR